MDPLSSHRLLVALDVDGTIMRADGAIGTAVRQQMLRLQARGHEVTLATGRPSASVIALLRDLGLRPEYAVCSNGAVILRRAPDGGYSVDSAEVFSPAAALRILRHAAPEAMFAVEEEGGDFLLTRRVADFGTQSTSRVVPFDDLVATRALRLIVVSDEIGSADLVDQLTILGLRPVVYAVESSTWLDIAPEKVDKARALERVRARLGVHRSRVVAVGDGLNDIEMLRWAGEEGRGVALGHAPDEVRAVATETGGSVDDDGAAGVLAAIEDIGAPPEESHR